MVRNDTFHCRRTILKSSGAVIATAVTLGNASAVASGKSGSFDPEDSSTDEIEDGLPDVFRIVDPNADAGFHFPYFLFVPRSKPDGERPIIVQGNNTPSTDDDYQVHLEYASRGIEQITGILAADLECPALVPAFPRFRTEPLSWDVYLQVLDDSTLELEEPPFERIDRQLVSMIEDAKARLRADSFDIADQIHLHGFSASSTFANRFTFLHPELVQAASMGGNGVRMVPTETLNGYTLPYPVGVADFEEITGREFDFQAWSEIEQYMFVGEEDQPLPEDDSRGYRSFANLDDETAEMIVDIFGENRVTERFPVTKSIYNEVGASTEFTVYEDVGHAYNAEIIADLVEFHRQYMDIREDGQQPEETPEPTESPTETPIRETTPTATETTPENTPGFGIWQAVIALGGIGYLLKERRSIE